MDNHHQQLAGGSDFSPGPSTSQGQGQDALTINEGSQPPQVIPGKKHGLAARFSRSTSSAGSSSRASGGSGGGISAMFGRKSTQPSGKQIRDDLEGQPLVEVNTKGGDSVGSKSNKVAMGSHSAEDKQGVIKTSNISSAGGGGVDESSDSEHDPGHHGASSGFRRKLSTNKEITNTASLKEGYLMKQTSSFQRWHRRYFKIKGKKLFYGKDEKAQIFDEIDLSDVTIADSSSKTFKHCFQVITQDRVLNLAAENRSAMEEWIHAIRSASNSNFYESGDHTRLLSGTHVWYATSHARPTYCNICREQLCGVTSHGLSCEICKFKAHKKCASRALNNCKWTTLASMGKEIIEESDGTLALPHQWLEGNLPVSAKCDVCEKTCGSVLRLQDWRCLWCRTTVHNTCRPGAGVKCPVGRISVVPPIALHTIGSDDAWEATRPLQGCSPLLVFVNSKSGDHQGLKFLRRFKQLLNPAQVFDLMNGGPRLGLQLFRHFEPFRILVCGGDGSVGWVMTEIDRLDMHRQCQVGVLPLGTGNDLARVLGWGASCDDDAHLPHLLEKYEKATTKMLDRWSIMAFERGVFLKPNCGERLRLGPGPEKPQIAQYEDSVVSHLQNILQSNQHQAVINSAKVLCETVRDMIGKIGSSTTDSEIDEKCANLSQKLNSLLQTLQEETEEVENEPPSPVEDEEIEVSPIELQVALSPSSKVEKKVKKFRKKEALMSRANSLKKAVRQIIEHAEKALDETTTPPPVVIVRPMTLAMQCPSSPCDDSSKEVFIDDDDDVAEMKAKYVLQQHGNNNLHGGASSSSSVIPIPSSSAGTISSPPEALSNTSITSSPIDPHVTLPVPPQFSDQYRKLSNASSTNSSIPGELEDEIAEPITLNLPLSSDDKNSSGTYLHINNNHHHNHGTISPGVPTTMSKSLGESLDDENENKVQFDTDETEKTKEEQMRRDSLRKASYPKIEIESPSSSSLAKTPKDSEESSEVEIDVSLGMDSSVISNNDSSAATPGYIYRGDGSQQLLVPGGGGTSFPRGASPRASRRISMGSLLKPLEVEIPKSPRSSGDSPDGCSYSSAANSPFSSSAHSSPHKFGTLHNQQKRKTLPIVNPLVSDPSWPAIAAGGVVSKVLLANADAICAVASPLMDPDIDQEELMIGFDEKCVMNNYFGIGIDAKITLDFHLKREEHPEKCRSRTRNFVWYGVLGGKEFLQKSCKNLEQKVQLECDGKRLPLPSLQGIVILNIQSFMGGTNFWGGTKEDDCFLAPSFDDKILEVVAVFDTMQMAASRLINLQHHRIAQCNSIKITILGDEPIPVQVDGEAWIQAPGVIRIVHKNRMQMLCRNRALESSLKAWEEKQKHLTMSPSPTEPEELDKKRHSRGVFKLKFKKEKHRNDDMDNFSDGISDETGSSEVKPVDKWTAIDVGEWLDHLQLEEYKLHFLRHDIQGPELLTLQRRDLRELGVTKIGHIKRILQSIDKLKKDSTLPSSSVITSSSIATVTSHQPQFQSNSTKQTNL